MRKLPPKSHHILYWSADFLTNYEIHAGNLFGNIVAEELKSSYSKKYTLFEIMVELKLLSISPRGSMPTLEKGTFPACFCSSMIIHQIPSGPLGEKIKIAVNSKNQRRALCTQKTGSFCTQKTGSFCAQKTRSFCRYSAVPN